MSPSEVPFEEPLESLRLRIEELEGYPEGSGHERELAAITAKQRKGIHPTDGDVAADGRVPARPHTLDYVEQLMSDWIELHGDRRFADDPAIVTGLATFEGRSVVVLGHQKGRSTKQRIHRNFGQPRPEGYRKALRMMKMAEKFSASERRSAGRPRQSPAT